MLSGKILITGGTGSLGTALTAFLLSRGVEPKNITLLARNETKLNQSRKAFPDVRCEAGDVRDLDWLRTIFPGHTYIIHAGALKVVPTAEVNVKETISTNVLGSQNVAMAAVESGVQRVIGISTDKACQAQTVYGASKFLMEGLFREANGWSENTSFNLVRYGNVLGSNQSVVPFFQNLVRKNAPITVTMFGMTRFWLGMDDALSLIWDSLFWAETGVVLVPKAKASDMLTLAKAVAPDNYPIVEIGRRAGEKIHEKMIHAGETHHTMNADKYYVIYHPATLAKIPLDPYFEYCSNTCWQFSIEELREKIKTSSVKGESSY